MTSIDTDFIIPIMKDNLFEKLAHTNTNTQTQKNLSYLMSSGGDTELGNLG